MLDAGLFAMYALLVGGIGLTIIFPILHALKSPKGFVKSLYGIGGLLVVFAISYVLSGDFVTKEQLALGVDASSSKLIGAGLIMFYIVLVISIVGTIFSEISKVFK